MKSAGAAAAGPISPQASASAHIQPQSPLARHHVIRRVLSQRARSCLKASFAPSRQAHRGSASATGGGQPMYGMPLAQALVFVASILVLILATQRWTLHPFF